MVVVLERLLVAFDIPREISWKERFYNEAGMSGLSEENVQRRFGGSINEMERTRGQANCVS